MAHLPPILFAQGVNNRTFTPPPFSLTVPEICDWHYKHSGSHPLYVYADDATNEVATVPWGIAVQGIYRISNSVIQSVQTLKTSETRPLIGLCSTSDSFTYLLTILGIMRAGYPVFLISPFAPPAALKHLLHISNVSLILTNTDDPELHSKLLAAVTDIKTGDPHAQPVISSQLSWSQIFSSEDIPKAGPNVPEYDLESTCIIFHSSGSTTLPRLNVWTHRMVAAMLWQPWYGEHDICGEIMSAASIPMAGGAGFMLALFPASSGLTISGFKPQSPPARPNPANVWTAIVATESTYAFILQPFLYMFSEDQEKRKILAQLKGVAFVGGPVRKGIGDQLALEGTNLLTLFGLSEGGLLNKVFTDNRGGDWEFFSFNSLVHADFIPQENSDLFELVMKTGPFHKPTQTNTVHNDVLAFATKDLLLPHPEKPDFWKYACRMDDQETLSNGMKINAVAFEAILASDPLIRGAVMFSNRPTFGVIVDPASEYAAKTDLSVPPEVAKFKSLIWPTVERFNQVIPELGKLNKEIILISTPDKPFVYGEKGFPRRKEAINSYIAEIKATVGPWVVD
ncbi:hypothetical protein B0H19DRAFT_590026 [Mycena capillaripes]|nr:hypothetical protein B0H19DRAFT_590026 [Mycena capillaripes]